MSANCRFHSRLRLNHALLLLLPCAALRVTLCLFQSERSAVWRCGPRDPGPSPSLATLSSILIVNLSFYLYHLIPIHLPIPRPTPLAKYRQAQPMAALLPHASPLGILLLLLRSAARRRPPRLLLRLLPRDALLDLLRGRHS